jgi:uncharacterized lipoprotein YddW (UPF0748 family)
VAWLLLALILFSLSGCSDERPSSEELPRGGAAGLGLWVLAEGSHRVLEQPDRMETLAETAEKLGATDLFVQVYRGGRSWFRSSLADDQPYRQIHAAHGLDPLPHMIRLAHARGIRVHAWFNALSLARNRDAPLLRTAGARAVLQDRKGRSLLDYPNFEVPEPDHAYLRMGSPQIWLDPSVPEVVEYLEGTVADLVAAGPDLDGLHLDYIRHPLALPLVPGSRFEGLDFGYGAEAQRAFEEVTGGPFRRGDRWDEFRRDRVGELARRLCTRIPESWSCSAAVLPWADRAYLTGMQDFRRWLEEGWLDFAVAMAYTRDDRLLRYLSGGLRGGVGGDRIWIGLGTWLLVKEVERVRRQIALARKAAPPGIALFSYDALMGAPDALQSLITEGTGT